MPTCYYKHCDKKINPNGTRRLYCSKSHKDKAYRLRQKQNYRLQIRRYNETIKLPKPELLQKKWGVKYGDLWIIPDPPHNTHKIFCGSWIDGDNLQKILNRQKIGLCVTDPPYTHNLGSVASWQSKASAWSDLMNNAPWYTAWFRLLRQNLADTGALWCFNSWRMFAIIQKAAIDCQWMLANNLTWDKKYFGPGKYARYQHENIALLPSPNFKIPNRRFSDVIQVPWPSTKPHHHPAEKPVKLYITLITESAIPLNSIIFDGFCGSGTAIEAAAATGHSGYGAEDNPKWLAFILERISQKFNLTPQLIERI